MKIRQFRVLVGTHYEADNTEFSAGKAGQDIVRTNIDLVAKFGKEKFAELSPVEIDEAPSAPKGASTGASSDSTGGSATGGAKVESALGEDVTESFPDAVKGDYKVFRKGKKHYVAEPQKADVALNKAGLSADDVPEFIAGLKE